MPKAPPQKEANAAKQTKRKIAAERRLKKNSPGDDLSTEDGAARDEAFFNAVIKGVDPANIAGMDSSLVRKSNELMASALLGYARVDVSNTRIEHKYYNNRSINETAVEKLVESFVTEGDRRAENPLLILVHKHQVNALNLGSNQFLGKTLPVLRVAGDPIQGLAGQHRLAAANQYLKAKQEDLAKLEASVCDGNTEEGKNLNNARESLRLAIKDDFRYWPVVVYARDDLPKDSDDEVVRLALQRLASNIPLVQYQGNASEQWRMARHWYHPDASHVDDDQRLALAKGQFKGNRQSEQLFMWPTSRAFLFKYISLPAFQNEVSVKLWSEYAGAEGPAELIYRILHLSLDTLYGLVTRGTKTYVNVVTTDFIESISAAYRSCFPNGSMDSKPIFSTFNQSRGLYIRSLKNEIRLHFQHNQATDQATKDAMGTIGTVIDELFVNDPQSIIHLPCFCPEFAAHVFKNLSRGKEAWSLFEKALDPMWYSNGSSSKANREHKTHDPAAAILKLVEAHIDPVHGSFNYVLPRLCNLASTYMVDIAKFLSLPETSAIKVHRCEEREAWLNDDFKTAISKNLATVSGSDECQKIWDLLHTQVINGLRRGDWHRKRNPGRSCEAAIRSLLYSWIGSRPLWSLLLKFNQVAAARQMLEFFPFYASQDALSINNTPNTSNSVARGNSNGNSPPNTDRALYFLDMLETPAPGSSMPSIPSSSEYESALSLFEGLEAMLQKMGPLLDRFVAGVPREAKENFLQHWVDFVNNLRDEYEQSCYPGDCDDQEMMENPRRDQYYLKKHIKLLSNVASVVDASRDTSVSHGLEEPQSPTSEGVRTGKGGSVSQKIAPKARSTHSLDDSPPINMGAQSDKEPPINNIPTLASRAQNLGLGDHPQPAHVASDIRIKKRSLEDSQDQGHNPKRPAGIRARTAHTSIPREDLFSDD